MDTGVPAESAIVVQAESKISVPSSLIEQLKSLTKLSPELIESLMIPAPSPRPTPGPSPGP
ncbi:MAG TPA: hypothetical protein PLB00_00335 [Pseudomonadota bacterium]|jgi:hypothetical protein|nr:hypothetical protein [Pseudomonadota bacterium]